MPRILVITRIYTSMVESFKTRIWQPTGMPAYYKLLEALDKESQVDAVCFGKVIHHGLEKHDIFNFSNLNINFHVVPYKKIDFIGTYLNRIYNEILQFFYCLRLVLHNRYELIYVDRVNIVYGAILALFFKKKVIVRLFGVCFLIRRMQGLKKWLKEPIRYLSFRAPFKYILCSKDGSGGRYFIENFMNKKVPHEILLNGVDKIEKDIGKINEGRTFLRSRYNIPDTSKVILFLARLAEDKCPDLFIESLIRLFKKNKDFFAVIAGKGPLAGALKRRIATENMSSHVKFIGQIEHDMVYSYYKGADIYVSLSTAGNLCNTVLEAINTGRCIATFKQDILDHTDEDTEKILSGKVAQINKRRTIEDLPTVLNELLNSKEKVEFFSLKTRELSAGLLQDWKDRIGYEVKLYKRIISDS